MAIFVEERFDVAVLHDAFGYVEDQRSDRHLAAIAVTERNGIGMLVFSGPRMRVEIDAPDELPVVVKLVRFDERVPLGPFPRPDVDAKQVLDKLEEAVPDPAVGEVF